MSFDEVRDEVEKLWSLRFGSGTAEDPVQLRDALPTLLAMVTATVSQARTEDTSARFVPPDPGERPPTPPALH